MHQIHTVCTQIDSVNIELHVGRAKPPRKRKVVGSNPSEFFSEKGAIPGELSCVALLCLPRVSVVLIYHVRTYNTCCFS